MNIHFAPSRVATFILGVTLAFGALGPDVQAQQVNVYQLSPGAYPAWDNGNPFIWSTGAAPTPTQTALFPSAPGPNTIFPALNANGMEVAITNLNPSNPTPGAANLIFLDNYRLISIPISAVGAPASFLTLNSGGVTVNSRATVLLDTNVVVTGGLLTKLGSGTLILDTNYTITGNALVAQGTFGGTGILLGNLVNLANVAPGDGRLTIGGNYTQQKSGTLSIGIASPASFDELVVAGKARLNGKLDVSLFNGFVPKKGEKFTIVDAARVSGQFSSVDAPVWDLLTLRPVYGRDTVTLKVVINSFEALPGLTANQNAVARSLDSAIYDPRAAGLLNFLYGRDLSDLPRQFDRIAPEELTSMFAMGMSLSNMQSLNLQQRTNNIRGGSNGFSAQGFSLSGSAPSYSGNFDIGGGVAGPTGDEGKEVKETKEVAPAENRWGAFVTGTGQWVNVSGTDNARGYDLTSGGFTLGVDYKVCPNFAIGIAAGYTGTTADLTDHGRVWVNGGKFGLYATTFAGGWYADVAAFGGYNSYDTRRSAIQGDARGDTDGGEVDALFGTGYDFKSGGFTFGPTGSFNYTYVGMNGFTENGSLAPLNVHSGNADSLRTAFGAKVSYDCKCHGVIIRPELRVAWQHEYGDTTYDLASGFANGAGGAFTTSGPRLGRDSVLVGAGFAVLFNDRCSTYLYYDGELGRENYESNAVTGGFRISF
jgi:outer membrane autotransporter protein